MATDGPRGGSSKAAARRQLGPAMAWVAASAFGLGAQAIAAQSLGLAEYGLFVLWTVAVNLLALLLGVGLPRSVIRLIAGPTRREARATHLRSSMIPLVLAGPTAILGLGASAIFAVSWALVLAVVALAVLKAHVQIASDVLLGMSRSTAASWYGLPIPLSIFAILMIAWRPSDVLNTILLQLTASVLTLAGATFWIRCVTSSDTDRLPPSVSALLDGARPFLKNGLLQQLNGRLDLWILASVGWASSAGAYGVGLRVGELTGVPLLLLSAVAPPKLAEGADARYAAELRSMTRLAAAISVTGLVLLAAIGPFIIPKAFGPGFEQALGIALVIATGKVFSVAAGPVGLALMMSAHLHRVPRVTALSGVATVALATVGGLTLGPVGVAWGTSLGLVLQNLLMVRLCRRLLGLRISAWHRGLPYRPSGNPGDGLAGMHVA
jgi:O-antigen/teichoic acid export membrane protein